MIDAHVTIDPAHDLVALDLWDGEPGDLLTDVRAIQVEPRRWWLIDAGASVTAIAAALGERGVVTPFGGGFVVATITGAWQELLSVSAFVDTERLPPGAVASTVIHHVPVRIVPREGERCQVFFAASYTETLRALWTASGAASGRP